MARCPSTLRLEAYLQTPGTSGLASHVDGCARCLEELRLMRSAADEFREVVYPATVEVVLGHVDRSRRRRN